MVLRVFRVSAVRPNRGIVPLRLGGAGSTKQSDLNADYQHRQQLFPIILHPCPEYLVGQL
jgi:hypothetical protein